MVCGGGRQNAPIHEINIPKAAMRQVALTDGLVGHLPRALLNVPKELPFALSDEVERLVERLSEFGELLGLRRGRGEGWSRGRGRQAQLICL